MVLTGWSIAPGVPSLAVSVRTSDPWRWVNANAPQLYRNLQMRKEMRENAWGVDGWASTVHKARPRTSVLFVRLMTYPIDISTRKDDGFTHFDTAVF